MVASGIFYPPPLLLAPETVTTSSLSTGCVSSVTQSSVDGRAYLSGLLRPLLCTADGFFLSMFSLGSDGCGDVTFSEAGFKLCQMRDRHSLHE